MDLIETTSFHLDRIARIFLATLMAILVIVVLFGVINRFIFQFSYSWMDEAARYLMIWSCMLGASIALRQGIHIGLSIIIAKLGRKQFWVLLLNNISVMFFLMAVTFYGTKLSFSQMARVSNTLGISMFWPLISVPVGSAVMIIHSIYLTKLLIQSKKE
ncbi:MAG: TRAP transporter small permease [Methanosarcinaceae archaeon]|nr:TRAP transporter small permease [Methanosarcinaceae archaeon]